MDAAGNQIKNVPLYITELRLVINVLSSHND